MTVLLNPRLWIAMILAAVLAFTHLFVYRAGKAVVNAAWQTEQLHIKDALAIDLESARKAEFQTSEKSAELRKKSDEQVADVNNRLADALARLRERPERPSADTENVPTPACPQPAGCTGKGLYEGDAEFLVGVAADASKLRVALEGCKAQYESARVQSLKAP